MDARIVSFVVAATVLLTPRYAVGQDVRPGQAYRGLFGPNTVIAAESLTVNGQVGAGWDSNLFLAHREEGFVLAPVTQRRNSGPYNLFAGGVAYAKNGNKLQFHLGESSAARRYPDYPLLASHEGVANISWTPSKRIELSSTHQFVYQPWQTLTSFPSLFGLPLRFEPALAPNQAYASIGGAYRSYQTTSGFTAPLSRQSTLTGGYSYQLSTYDNSAAFVGPFQFDVFATGHSRFTNQTGSLRFNRGVTSHFSWHLGYAYSEARFRGDSRRFRTHILDSGVDYARALSITRRTTFSFSTGAIAAEQDDFRRYDVAATATLGREIGRTWNASATYVRNAEYLDTVRVPYFYDGVVLQLTGLISRRTGFHSSAGATIGDLGINRVRGGRARFDTEYGNVGVGFAFSRYLAVNTDYVFYMYSVNQLGVLLPSSAPQLHRHDVVIYLNAWAPVFERGRKTNAAR
jgi:hypothetical protein